MRVISEIGEMARARVEWQGGRRSCGFAPTMGYLHAGHVSLVEHARAAHEVVVVSIFVNPTQFGPHEDLARYPRDLPRDLALLEAAGVDIVFTPSVAEMYPAGFGTYVEPSGALSLRLEAATRPGHFRGVATVVLKLFNVTQPTEAYFGQKDAQQVAVLRRLVTDLDIPVTLRVLPTLRQADGLALSSRNSYLDAADRQAATALYRALRAGAAVYRAGETVATAAEARRAMVAVIEAEPRITLDYAEVCDPATFEAFAPEAALRPPALLALAARVGSTRLIDNALLGLDGAWDLGSLSHEAAGSEQREQARMRGEA